MVADAPDTAKAVATISVVIPSYGREAVLLGTLEAVLSQRCEADEVIVVDQTRQHEKVTAERLGEMERNGLVRWVRKLKPSICEAMNLGAALAKGDVIVFLDDDARPLQGYLEAYRRLFSGDNAPLAACGQILQPWNEQPLEAPGGDPESFNFASSQPGEIVGVMAGNFAVRRDVFLEVGGMDETFRGGAYRCDAEVGYRLLARTGRMTRFWPEAAVRHLQADGGTRAHGHKDSWAAIESAVGDYYFALRCLRPPKALWHILGRMRRAPFNKHTLRRPWLVPLILVREAVAMFRAIRRNRQGGRYIRRPSQYSDFMAEDAGKR